MYKNKSAAIMVTYFPKKEFYTNLNIIANQVDMVVVYDNSDNINGKIDCNLLYDNCILFSYHQNHGIGKALNDSLKYLNTIKKYDYIFTFDQDTLVDSSFTSNMIIEYTKVKINDVLIVTPTIYDVNQNVIGLHTNPNEEKKYKEIQLAITSSSMLVQNIVELDLLFNEDFFIDHVDHEFCIRARELGYKLISLSKVKVDHELGLSKIKRIFWKKFIYQEHSALRLYYFVRNGFTTIKNNNDKYFKNYFIKTLLKKVIKATFLEDNKIQKISFMTLGFYHFLINKKGSLND